MNWEIIKQEASKMLSEYIQVCTINPPGDEVKGCNWLASIAENENLDYSLMLTDDKRANFITQINKDLQKKSKIILLNHIDVVPASSEEWKDDPFSGVIRDGYVCGRGALDMKGMAIIELMTLILLKRNNYKKNNVIFLATADEESGSKQGVNFLLKNHKEVLDADLVINEGGIGTFNAFNKQENIFNIGISEKSPLWLKIIINAESGHGSKQNFQSSTYKLILTLQKIIESNHSLQLSKEVEQYYRYLHQAGMIDVNIDNTFLNDIRNKDKFANSILTNTIAITRIDAGYKNNVVPSTASASLDIRLVPGYSASQFISDLQLIINDPTVVIKTIFHSSTKTSSINNKYYEAINQSIKKIVPNAIVVPYVTSGFTDSRIFREMNIPAYGFIPILVTKQDLLGIHGIDEKISIDNLLLGIKILYEFLTNID
ncbi:MAG: Acetylornithine deacetylase/Succinyl-diaminopimelate desuccinylase [Chloroflexi bacterium]|jgi:acetylornithine deacetylase/succinyl-diaminopimelate desuccinylase-like protein|nr:MAG: Acetylornithine deacetylase/Succinyl-diaminopimelate desuccinylase [Chloroflexota bacterium]|tara:strand:- start:4615 stop:5904 length:1290 start_codon:yes stop_codon:yes gene_type:complete